MSFQEIMDEATKQFKKDAQYYLKYGVKSVFLRGVQKNLGYSDDEFDYELRQGV